MPYQYYGEVTRIVDGDTIDATLDLGFNTYIKERFRFAGINTPESRTRDLEEKSRGLAAKKFVEEKIPVGSTVIIETEKAGKYGRWLAVVYTLDSDISLNQMLLNEGHAKEYGEGNWQKN